MDASKHYAIVLVIKAQNELVIDIIEYDGTEENLHIAKPKSIWVIAVFVRQKQKYV